MYARVTTLHVQPGKLGEFTGFMRDAGSPTLKQQPGFQGLLVLTDPKTERAMTIALWANKADIEASAAASYTPVVIAKLASFVTGLPVREDYEVVIQEWEESGTGVHARVTLGQVQPGKLNELAALLRNAVLPVARRQRGHQGALLLANRETSKNTAISFVAISFWETAADLEAGEASPDVQEALTKPAPLLVGERTVERYEVGIRA